MEAGVKAATAARDTWSRALCSSSTLSVPCAKRCSVTDRMGETLTPSLSTRAVCSASASCRTALTERGAPHPSLGGLCRGGSLGARRTRLYRRALRLAKRFAVCVLYLLLPLLLFDSMPPSAPPQQTPARAATAALYTPFLFARAAQFNLTLAFQTSDHADDACRVGSTATPTPLQWHSDSDLAKPLKGGPVRNGPTCPYYPMWALLSGEHDFEVPTSVIAGTVNANAVNDAGVEGGADGPTRAHERRGRAAVNTRVTEAEAHRRTSKIAAAAAAPPGDFISPFSSPRNALTQYYQLLSTDTFFLMLQGCTIRVSVDTSAQQLYPYQSFQQYADAYRLSVSATGADGGIQGHSSLSGNSAFSANTRGRSAEGHDPSDATYPNITLRTAFFFWNQPRLHCTLNAPALMSVMIDSVNQQRQQQELTQSPLRSLPSQKRAREESRRALFMDGAVSGEASPPLTVGEMTTDSATPSSIGSVYPSCAAHMPSPNDILSSSQDIPITMDYMQLGSAVVVKVFSFDVWYQLVGAPVRSDLNTAHASATTAPSSASFASFFSPDPHMRGSAGASTGSPTTAGHSFDLLADPEKVCSAPALYTISLNALLAQASSRNLGSAAGSLQPSVTVTHEYPSVRVITVVAQCSGVPLSFSVTASFVNPGNFAGSGELYFTSITYFFFLVCYALLLVVFLVMIVPCNKRRRRQQQQQLHDSSTSGKENGSTSGGPGQAATADEKQSPAGSAQRCTDRASSCGTRGQRRDSYAAGADSRDSHLEEDVGGATIPAKGASKGKVKTQAAVVATSAPSGLIDNAPAAVKGNRRGQSNRSSPSTASAAAAEPRARALTPRGTTDGCEGDDSQTDLSSLYSVHSRTSRTSSLSGDEDVDGGSLDAQKGVEARAEGAGGRGCTQSSQHSVPPMLSSLMHTSSFTLSSSSSGDDPDRTGSSSSLSDSTHDDDDGDSNRATRQRRRPKKQRCAKREKAKRQQQRSRQRRHVLSSSSSRGYAANDLDGDSRSSSTDATEGEWYTAAGDANDNELRREEQRRRRGCRERGAQVWRKRGNEQRKCVSSARINAQGAASALASPRRWRARVKRISDAVRRHVLDPLQVWWADSHILVMYAPIQWVVLILIMLKCLLSILFAARFFMLGGVDLDIDSIGYSLPLVSVIFEVATDSLLIPTEMLVAMGWGLALTTPLPTNHIVVAALATLAMFITFVFSATCERERLSMAVTVNPHSKSINGRQCNTIAYTRIAFELACRIHNVLRMVALTVWLSKTVVPADAAAVRRQRKLRQRQLLRAQREDHSGHAVAGTGDGSGKWESAQSDLHRRTSSASSSSIFDKHTVLSLGSTADAVTGSTATLPSAPISLRPPPRLGYPGVSLSAMEVYLRYRSMWIPFAMLLVWPILLLVCGFTLYEPEDYYMLVALREVQVVHLLGFIIAFLRTASPLYC